MDFKELLLFAGLFGGLALVGKIFIRSVLASTLFSAVLFSVGAYCLQQQPVGESATAQYGELPVFLISHFGLAFIAYFLINIIKATVSRLVLLSMLIFAVVFGLHTTFPKFAASLPKSVSEIPALQQPHQYTASVEALTSWYSRGDLNPTIKRL